MPDVVEQRKSGLRRAREIEDIVDTFVVKERFARLTRPRRTRPPTYITTREARKNRIASNVANTNARSAQRSMLSRSIGRVIRHTPDPLSFLRVTCVAQGEERETCAE